MINSFIKKLLIIKDDEPEHENAETMESIQELFDIARHTEDPALNRRIISGIREAADNYLTDNNPIGYRILSLWYGFCGDYSNSIVCDYVAAKKGITDSIAEITRLEREAENNENVSLTLAETCFLVGDDEKGMEWMNKTAALGSEVGELGISLREKGNIVKLSTHQELPYAISRFKLRLFKQVIVDYKDIDEDYLQKVVFFTRGASFALGSDISIDEKEKKAYFSHGCKERVLKECFTDEMSDRINVKCFEDSETVAERLIHGNKVLVDFSKCPYEDATKCFDYISGVCIALDGMQNNEGKDLYLYTPKLMEYQGLPLVETGKEYEDS